MKGKETDPGLSFVLRVSGITGQDGLEGLTYIFLGDDEEKMILILSTY